MRLRWRDLEAGNRLDGYRLVERAGEGSQGHVWRAERADGSNCAIKVLPLDEPGLPWSSEEIRDHVERELLLAASTRHPHLVSIEDNGELEDAIYVVMPLLEGQDLGERGRATNEHEFGSILVQVATALASLHQVGGFAHRDVKPANIVVKGSGSLVHATLVDTGTLKALDGSPTRLVGTPGYFPPALLLGEEISDRTDVYALGALAMYLLGAKPPVPGLGENALLFARRIELSATPRPSTYQDAPDWAAKYDAIIGQALAFSASDRQSPAEFAEQIMVACWPPGAPHHLRALITDDPTTVYLQADLIETMTVQPPDELVEPATQKRILTGAAPTIRLPPHVRFSRRPPSRRLLDLAERVARREPGGSVRHARARLLDAGGDERARSALIEAADAGSTAALVALARDLDARGERDTAILALLLQPWAVSA